MTDLTVMAWRNLWRRKRRTWITAISVAFGVLLSVTFTGMADYSYKNMINTSARMGMGHITLQAPGYHDQPSLEKRIRFSVTDRRQLLQNPAIATAVGRITGQAMFASARKTVGGFFYAIDPRQDNTDAFYLLQSLVDGKVFERPGDRSVVIGLGLAEKLNLRLGKKLVYTTTDINGDIVSDVARVVGLFRTGIDDVDGAAAVFAIDSVRQLLSYDENEVSLVAITIKDQRKLEQPLASIRADFGGRAVEVLDWRRTQADLAGLINIDMTSNYLLQFLIGLVIAAGILNTLLMSVMERSQEFGVMLAVGMSARTLFRLVLVESLWIAIMGLFVGLLITGPAYYYLSTVGIDLGSSLGDNYQAGGVLLDPIMKIQIHIDRLLWILLGVFGLTLLSGMYPAWKAGRIVPVKSLRTI